MTDQLTADLRSAWEGNPRGIIRVLDFFGQQIGNFNLKNPPAELQMRFSAIVRECELASHFVSGLEAGLKRGAEPQP